MGQYESNITAIKTRTENKFCISVNVYNTMDSRQEYRIFLKLQGNLQYNTLKVNIKQSLLHILILFDNLFNKKETFLLDVESVSVMVLIMFS